MTEIKKSVLGSVRLDSDVWEAVRGMPQSLNQYLRYMLLENGEVDDGGDSDPLAHVREDLQVEYEDDNPAPFDQFSNDGFALEDEDGK